MTWEVRELRDVEPTRGADGSLKSVRLTVARRDQSSGSVSGVRYDLTYRVGDDGTASVRSVENASPNAATVAPRHLSAMVVHTDAAVENVPGVERVERLAVTLTDGREREREKQREWAADDLYRGGATWPDDYEAGEQNESGSPKPVAGGGE